MAAKGAGELTHQVQVQEDRGTTKDAHGNHVPDWQMVVLARCKIEPLRGREFWQAAQVQSDATHLITFRFRPGWTSRMRALYGTRKLYFVEPPRDIGEGHEFMEVFAREEDPNRED